MTEALAMDDFASEDMLLATTDEFGALVLTPCGPLDEELSRTLLHAAASATSSGITRIVVDLRRVPSYTERGVHAVRCCRRLAETSATTVRFQVRGGVSQLLLLSSYGQGLTVSA